MAPSAASYAYGNCTYYVAERFPLIYNRMGNAIDWIGSAKKEGYPVIAKPMPNTIVVYGSGYSPYGHVAVVDSVNGDGTFNVTEMNYSGWNVINHRKSTMWNVLGFIVPPGTTVSQLSSQQSSAPTAPQWQYKVSLLGNDVFLDGVMGWSAMIVGGFIMLAGVTVMVAFSLKNSGIGNKATQALSVIPNPIAQVAARAAQSSQAKTETPKKTAVPTKEDDDTAHNERMTKAKSRVESEPTRVYTGKTGKKYEVNLESGADYGKRREVKTA